MKHLLFVLLAFSAYAGTHDGKNLRGRPQVIEDVEPIKLTDQELEVLGRIQYPTVEEKKTEEGEQAAGEPAPFPVR